MYTIDVYKTDGYADIFPLPVKRDWMDETFEAHAYKCFPVTLTNSLGWGISFPEDIVFKWDGISDSSPDHVKILSGHKYAYSGRANGTISFNTGLAFISDSNSFSLLHMPVPNFWVDGAQAFTTIISPSVIRGNFPCAWRITRPDTEITIKAGTPVVAIVPISTSAINNSEIIVKNVLDMPKDFFLEEAHYKKMEEISSQGKWSNFYREGVDYKGNILGEHETKSIRLKVIDNRTL